MCTVTYLPKNNGDYILTSNRDEAIVRTAALEPADYLINGKVLTFPKDPVGTGSWIAHSEKTTACLLNGGFKKHEHKPPYKKSRGLMLIDYFTYENTTLFISEYDFSGIEPFTLILLENQQLYELRWDEKKIHLTLLDCTKPHIWSSVTLYSDEIIAKRNRWFQTWLATNNEYTAEAIRKFHHSAGDGDTENNVLMNRKGKLMTVSITSIEKKGSSFEMIYQDLITKVTSVKKTESIKL